MTFDEDSEYPLRRTKVKKTKNVLISLTDDEKADLQLMADLWNRFDDVLETKEGRKWERKSVAEQGVRNSINRFWKQIGGRPPTADLRESVIKATIARLEEKFPPKPAAEEPAPGSKKAKR